MHKDNRLKNGVRDAHPLGNELVELRRFVREALLHIVLVFVLQRGLERFEFLLLGLDGGGSDR